MVLILFGLAKISDLTNVFGKGAHDRYDNIKRTEQKFNTLMFNFPIIEFVAAMIQSFGNNRFGQTKT